MTKSTKLNNLAALAMIASFPVPAEFDLTSPTIDALLALEDADTGAEIETLYTHEEAAILTDDELLQALDQAELDQAPTGQEDDQAVDEEVTDDEQDDEGEEDTRSLEELVDDLEPAAVSEKADDILDAFDARIDAERVKDPHNDSIVKSLNKSRSKLGQLGAAAVMIACEVDEGFINRSINTGAAYNVYAIDKCADIMVALRGGAMGNAINNAVMRSMFKFRAAGEVFTGEMAKAAASDKIRLQGNLQKHLVRHTVSASTAPTQASSTMSALQTLGIVINKGSQKLPIYELTDTPATALLLMHLEVPTATARDTSDREAVCSQSAQNGCWAALQHSPARWGA